MLKRRGRGWVRAVCKAMRHERRVWGERHPGEMKGCILEVFQKGSQKGGVISHQEGTKDANGVHMTQRGGGSSGAHSHPRELELLSAILAGRCYKAKGSLCNTWP